MQTTVKKTVINKTHKAIINQFGSITKAAEVLRFTRKALYNIIHNGHTEVSEDRVRGRGYDPHTFEKITRASKLRQ